MNNIDPIDLFGKFIYAFLNFVVVYKACVIYINTIINQDILNKNASIHCHVKNENRKREEEGIRAMKKEENFKYKIW